MPLKEGACELKISKFEGLRAKICSKIDAMEAKIFIFFSKVFFFCSVLFCFVFVFVFEGSCVVNRLFCLKWDPCEPQERHEKRVFRVAHPHVPFLGRCPRGFTLRHSCKQTEYYIISLKKKNLFSGVLPKR